MIRRIVIERFKSFKRVDLTLGHFNLFIGPNASGKSNFLDALRVLQGIGYGLNIGEILNGKPKSPIGEVWAGIRGGVRFVNFFAEGSLEKWDNYPDSSIKLSAHMDNADGSGTSEYCIVFEAPECRVVQESLTVCGRPLFTATTPLPPELNGPHKRVAYKGSQPHEIRIDGLSRQLPLLTQLAGHEKVRAEDRRACMNVAQALSDAQYLEPSPAVLRSYSSNRSAKRMGGNGENFAAMVKLINEDIDTKQAYLSWLQELTPAEMNEIHIFSGALDEPLFGVRLGPRRLPAPVLSDGTLRFAALTAAFFQPDMPRMMVFEEIENGIHSSRLRLLLDLMRSQARAPAPQVFATSHSPVILDWLDPADYASVFVCRRNPDTYESTIRTLAEVLQIASPGGAKLSDLAVEGWFEAVP